MITYECNGKPPIGYDDGCYADNEQGIVWSVYHLYVLQVEWRVKKLRWDRNVIFARMSDDEASKCQSDVR